MWDSDFFYGHYVFTHLLFAEMIDWHLIVSCYPIRKLLSRQTLVPRTYRGHPPPASSGRPLKILFDRLGDVPIWGPWDVLLWRPGDVLKWRLMFNGHPWEVDSGRPQDILRTSPRGFSKYSNLDVPTFFSTFLSELIRLTISI